MAKAYSTVYQDDRPGHGLDDQKVPEYAEDDDQGVGTGEQDDQPQWNCQAVTKNHFPLMPKIRKFVYVTLYCNAFQKFQK